MMRIFSLLSRRASAGSRTTGRTPICNGFAAWRRLLPAGILVAAMGAVAAPVGAQVGFDRPGGDYSSFVVKSGDPVLCAARCDREARCRSWSFLYPEPGALNAICWLKNQVPHRVANPCCASGIKGAGVLEPRDATIEFSIDRVGGDYRSFETPPDPTGKACAAACEADTRCRAWTYLRPGYEGPVARCSLKERVTPPRRKPCCVSGVVR